MQHTLIDTNTKPYIAAVGSEYFSPSVINNARGLKVDCLQDEFETNPLLHLVLSKEKVKHFNIIIFM